MSESETSRKTIAGWEWAVLLAAVAVQAGLVSRYLLHAHANFYTFINVAEFENWYWHATHGRLFFTTLPKPSPHLYVTPLALAPIYALLPSPQTILVGRAAWIALGALPVWTLARLELDDRKAALGFAVWYLANALIVGVQTDHYFNPEGFAIPAILSAVWAWRAERPRVFVLFVALIALTKEDLALTAAAMGLLAVMKPGWRRLGAGVAAASIAYFALAVSWWVPELAGTEHYVPTAAGGYTPWGEGLDGILAGMIARPGMVLRETLTLADGRYVLVILVSAAFLPLAAPGIFVAAAPSMAINLLSFDQAQVDPFSLYNAAPAAFSVAAAIVGTATVRRRLEARGNAPRGFYGFVITLLIALSSLFLVAHPGPANRLPDRHRAECLRTLALIPPGASVAATQNFLPHLAGRAEVYDIRQDASPDDILIETNPTHWIVEWMKADHRHQERIDALVHDKRYRLAFQMDGILLYRKNAE